MSKTVYQGFIKENIAPFAADKIVVINNETQEKVGKIDLPASFKPEYGKRLYRFGLLSDIHLEAADTSESRPDFINALSFFNKKESIEFTCICGDISQDALPTEFQYYKDLVAQNSPDTPVYTCTGNHDCPSGTNLDESYWESYTGCKRVFEVSKPIGDKNDHFLFLGLNDRKFGSNEYLMADIEWLESKLEAYKYERCFVITHVFFNGKAGDYQNIYPYSRMSSAFESRLLALLTKYPHAIWFSGHSHWKWYLQESDKKANVLSVENESNHRTEAVTIHVPSCAKPRNYENNIQEVYVTEYLHSEGAVVDVYEKYIDIRGIEFKGEGENSYENNYLPIANYRIETPYLLAPEPVDLLTASDFTVRKGDSSSFRVEDDTDGYVKVTFDKIGNYGFLVKSKSWTGHDTSCNLKVYDFQFVSPESSQWTNEMKNAVAFQTFIDGNYGYTQSDSVVRVDEEDHCVHFNMSKSFPSNVVFPVILRFKANLIFSA